MSSPRLIKKTKVTNEYDTEPMVSFVIINSIKNVHNLMRSLKNL